jgi:hypothetical protein
VKVQRSGSISCKDGDPAMIADGVLIVGAVVLVVRRSPPAH